MKGNNDQDPDKQDNKASSSGGKSKLPLYICAGVVAVALAIGGYFVFADNPPEVPVIEENGPQDPNDPNNNGGGIATGEETTSPAATATISPTPEETPTLRPPDTPPPDDPTFDPSEEDVTFEIVITPTGEVTIVPTALATVAPPPSAAPSKVPVTPDNPPTPPPPTGTPTPRPTPTSTPTPKPDTPPPPPPSEAPKTGPEYVDTARSNIAKKKGVIEVMSCKWYNVYGGFGGNIKYTDGTVTVTVSYEYYLESGILCFNYVNANGEERFVVL